MKYQCPSCYLQWKDDQNPRDRKCTPLCVFCSLKHTQKELLNWQSDHIENLDPSKIPLVFKYMFRYFELEIANLREEFYDERKKRDNKDNRRKGL